MCNPLARSAGVFLLAKIGADTAENEQHFAETLPTDALPRSPRARLALRAATPTLGLVPAEQAGRHRARRDLVGFSSGCFRRSRHCAIGHT